MIGRTIAHYKIIEKIGAGGMGVVYKAEDTKLGRLVALKFLPPYAVDSDEDRIRFLNEAQAAASLDHPNICTVHEINEADGHYYIAMAFVDGPSLKQKVQAGPLPIPEAVDIAAQIAAGLARAHEKGIVHRDIKPANVLLTRDGTAKILDFGLAKSSISKRVTRTGSTIGTAAYMSPEQARGEKVDHRADIWSLGVVLYEMLSGTPPFAGEHEAVVIYAILNEECTPLENLRPETPPALVTIVRRAMAKDAAWRYQDIVQMQSDLRVVMGDVSPLGRISLSGVRPPVVPDTTKKRSSTTLVSLPPPHRATRRTRLSYLAVIVLLFLLAATIGVLKLRSNKNVGAPGAEDSSDTAAATAALSDTTSALADSAVPTIAVLYLDNLSGDKDEDFFAAGLTEDIIINLSNIRQLRVLSRHDVLPYRGQPLSVAAMGKKLKADYLMEGSVRRDKKDLRLTVQLHKVEDGAKIWAQRFDRQLTDVFRVQSEIADSVAATLAVKIAPDEEQRLARVPTDNIEAYDYYIKGRQFVDLRSKEDNEQAEKMFKRALALDKDYALAQIGLADVYLQRVDWSFDVDQRWVEEAKTWLDRAAVIDTTSADLYLARGTMYYLRGENTAAVRETRRAVELRPHDHLTHYNLGVRLYFDRQWDEAERELRRTNELRADYPESYRFRARIAHYSGQPKEAERLVQKARQIAPDAAHILGEMSWIYRDHGEFAKAESSIVKAVALKPGTANLIGQLGRIECMTGRIDKAVDHLRDAAESTRDRRFYAWLGWARLRQGKEGDAKKAFRTQRRLLEEEQDSKTSQPADEVERGYEMLLIDCLLGEAKDPEPELKRLSGLKGRTLDPTVRSFYTAAVYAALGQKDRACDFLEKVLSYNVYSRAYLAADPRFTILRDHPRFQTLTKIP